MITETNKIQFFLNGLTLIIALVILFDFALPGKVYVDDEIKVQKEREQYYNAGGNYHYTYKIVTSKHQFSVSEDFAKLIENKKIQYSVSLLFKEINRYELFSTGHSNIYSFRIASGLIFPLIMIVAFIIRYFFKKKFDLLIVVLQIVLLLNLILLIL